MNRLKTLIILLVAVLSTAIAQRHFLHPGITYTQADIDRMRAMIDAQQLAVSIVLPVFPQPSTFSV